MHALDALDHLVYRVPDLDATIDDLERHLGVRAVLGGVHPGRGTRNALLDLGAARYLEVLAPDPAQPPPPEDAPVGPPEPVARLATWAAKSPIIATQAEMALHRGVDIGPARPMSRERPDGVLLRWRLTTGRRPGDGLVPFLIDWGDAPHPSEDAPGGCRIVALRAEHPEPARIAALLDALELGLDVTEAGLPALIATIETPRGTVELR